MDESELGGEVNPELLEILVDPLDKGPLELSSDGKWLINPRNGYRYPIRRGIPVMLIEEGRKYRDESLIRQGNGAG
ncbi:MAG TPA: Trm112 family protein [Anaerolineae bacterium]|nr:Trm112 family protein [Anaerolineae bacterium]HIQ06625.1 Trm112 family protein [Anaerolineae bacterium]